MSIKLQTASSPRCTMVAEAVHFIKMGACYEISSSFVLTENVTTDQLINLTMYKSKT